MASTYYFLKITFTYEHTNDLIYRASALKTIIFTFLHFLSLRAIPDTWLGGLNMKGWLPNTFSGFGMIDISFLGFQAAEVVVIIWVGEITEVYDVGEEGEDTSRIGEVEGGGDFTMSKCSDIFGCGCCLWKTIFLWSTAADLDLNIWFSGINDSEGGAEVASKLSPGKMVLFSVLPCGENSNFGDFVGLGAAEVVSITI